MYMKSMDLKFRTIHYFYVHFHLTTTVKVDEMHDNLEEMVPKITKFDHTIKIKSYENYHLNICSCSIKTLLFIILYSDYNSHSE